MIPGAFNFRDVGPVPVRGGRLAEGRVFRSDLLHRIDQRAADEVLDRLGVTRVIDLRTDPERDADGCLRPAPGREVIGVSVLSQVWSWDDEHSAQDEWFLRDRTIEMIEERGERIVDVLELVATSEGAVVIHCTAGKDRTGVVCAAMLGVLGAERDAIVEDYAASSLAMPALVDWYRTQAAVTGPATPEEETLLRRAARPETMAAVVDHMAAGHGGFGAWVAAQGWDDEGVGALRESVVDPE